MKMQLFSCSLLLVVLAVKQTPGQAASAPEHDHAKTPQLLYLKKLREDLKNTRQILTTEDKQIGGSLLATSIEAENITGPGNTSDGFVMQAGNKYVMEFFVPRKTESSYIQNAELWIFPHSMVRPEGRFQRMSLLISAELEHASRPRKEVLDIIWDTRKDCIALNLTSLSRKISRNLVKNQLEQANISVSVELVSRSRQPHPTTDHIIDKCSAVAEKQSKNPFLVVKYFVEQPVDLSTLTSRQRKSATVPTTTSQNCSLVPLNANLTKIFGDSLLLPKVLDISDCYGSCNLLKNRNDFTFHAFLVETIKQTDVNAPLYTRKTSCVPVQYKPEYVLFTEDKKMSVLVLFENMIVTECGCC